MPLLMSLLVGFSVGAALLLALALATVYRSMELPLQSRLAGYLMLFGLAATQIGNAELLQAGADAAPARRYIVVLFLQSLGFYWLLLGVVRPADRWQRLEWLVPVAVALLALSIPLRWGIPVALAMGAGFALHLAMLLYRLRAQRRWFRLELPVVAIFAVMGLLSALMGLLSPQMFDWRDYAWTYASCIAAGFFLVCWLLLAVPDLVQKTSEAVSRSYAQSTLGKVDQDAALTRLRQLFEVERVYQNEALNLSTVAELMELSTHQLSELVNTRLDLGFSRLVRRYRVQAAQRMLVDEPRASVLSVGLSVGFSSQSAFYLAFKEELGMVPGQYRRQQR
ncbi:MAG: helix-turn-helix domain-containing protein [Lysobacterales bacterium]